MTLRTYLNIMLVSTVLAGVSWGLVLYYINPKESGMIGFFLFYTTLFFTLVGVFTLIGFRLRQYFLNNELLFVLIGLSFRQAIWIALVLIGILMMQGLRILTWWDALLFSTSIFLLEVYFLTD